MNDSSGKRATDDPLALVRSITAGFTFAAPVEPSTDLDDKESPDSPRLFLDGVDSPEPDQEDTISNGGEVVDQSLKPTTEDEPAYQKFVKLEDTHDERDFRHVVGHVAAGKLWADQLQQQTRVASAVGPDVFSSASLKDELKALKSAHNYDELPRSSTEVSAWDNPVVSPEKIRASSSASVGSSTEGKTTAQKRRERKLRQQLTKEKRALGLLPKKTKKRLKKEQEMALQRQQASLITGELVKGEKRPIESLVSLPGIIKLLPQKSKLNTKEHERFVAMLLNFQTTGEFKFADNLGWFQGIRKLLKPEHEQFIAHVKRTAAEIYPHPYDKLPQAAQRYSLGGLRAKFMQAERYARHYALQSKFSFSKSASESDAVEEEGPLHLMQALLHIGKPARVVAPNLHNKALVASLAETERMYPHAEREKKPNLAADSILAQLTAKWEPQVCISVGALKALILALAKVSDVSAWDMPIVVRTYTGRYGKPRQVIIFCKPLAPLKSNIPQRCAWFMKYAAKTTFRHVPKAPLPVATRPTEVKPDIKPELLTPVTPPGSPLPSGLVIDDAEFSLPTPKAGPSGSGSAKPVHVPGVASPHLQQPGKRRIEETNEEKRKVAGQEKRSRPSEPASSGGGLVLDFLLDLQSKLHTEGVLRTCDRERTRPETSAKKPTEPCEEPTDYDTSGAQLPPGYRRSYAMWELKELTILLRATIDGVWTNPHQHNQQTVAIVPKIDYQSDYAADVLTPSESLSQYLTLLLKQCDAVMQVRLNHLNCEIMANDVMKLDALFALEHVKQNFERGVQNLDTLFRQLLQLSLIDGQYLLRFDAEKSDLELWRPAGMDDFSKTPEASLILPLAEKTAAEIFDLHEFYRQQFSVAYVPAELPAFGKLWRSLDPNVVLQWHRIKKRIPCAFEPRADNERTPGTPGDAFTRKKKRSKWFDKQQRNMPEMKQEGAQEGPSSSFQQPRGPPAGAPFPGRPRFGGPQFNPRAGQPQQQPHAARFVGPRGGPSIPRLRFGGPVGPRGGPSVLGHRFDGPQSSVVPQVGPSTPGPRSGGSQFNPRPQKPHQPQQANQKQAGAVAPSDGGHQPVSPANVDRQPRRLSGQQQHQLVKEAAVALGPGSSVAANPARTQFKRRPPQRLPNAPPGNANVSKNSNP